MNPHDPFFRSLLATKQHAVELLEYLKHANPSLKNTLKNVNLQTLTRIPGDYSNTEEFGYADLAFTANVNSDIIIRIGILMEHKSFKDENVLNQLYKYHYHLMRDNILGLNVMSPTIALIIYNGQEKWNPIEKIYRRSPRNWCLCCSHSKRSLWTFPPSPTRPVSTLRQSLPWDYSP